MDVAKARLEELGKFRAYFNHKPVKADITDKTVEL